MSKHFLHLRITSPHKVEYEGEVKMVVIPGVEGELGILYHHIPVIVQLKEGTITIHEQSDVVDMNITGGVAEMGANNRLEILVK